jgi:hypothetical protein
MRLFLLLEDYFGHYTFKLPFNASAQRYLVEPVLQLTKSTPTDFPFV